MIFMKKLFIILLLFIGVSVKSADVSMVFSPMSIKDATNAYNIAVDANGAVKVIGITGSPLSTEVISMPTNSIVIGYITNDTDCVTNDVPNGCSTVALQLTGVWTGQINFEGTLDGINWLPISAYNGSSTVNATSGNGIFVLPGGGYMRIRTRAVVAMTGVATNVFNSSIGPTASVQTGSTPQGANYIGQVGITNNAGGYNIVSTNILIGVTNAGVANYCAWSCTSAVLRVVGGAGIIQNISLRCATNKDWNIFIFDKVITAPTAGAAWAPTQEDLQYLVWMDATTNSLYPAWTLAGTNYIKTMRNLGVTFQNKDASVNAHIIATYLDTKTNYTANSYLTIGTLSD